MNQPEDRLDSVYNDPSVFPVWKPDRPVSRGRLSPRARAGIGAGVVVLAATGMITWSQYETAQANADVHKQQIALQQAQLNLQLAQQQAQLAKSSGQETPAQAARRQAMEKCVAAAGSSYNGIQDCANAFPAIDSTGALNDAQSAASSTPTSGGSSSPVGLAVLGATAAVIGVGWAKKKLARN